MSFFTDTELTELRDLAESAMDITVTVRAPGAKSFDAATGRTTFASGATRYTGKATIRPVRPARIVEVGEEQRAFRQATVHLPYTATMPLRDDLLTVDAATRNAQLVGEVFRVVGVAYDSDLVSWTLTVEHTAGSRTTPE